MGNRVHERRPHGVNDDEETYSSDRFLESDYLLETVRTNEPFFHLVAFTTAGAVLGGGEAYEPAFEGAEALLPQSPFESYAKCTQFTKDCRSVSSDSETVEKLLQGSRQVYDFVVFSLVTSRLAVRSVPTRNLCKYMFEVEHSAQKEEEFSRQQETSSFLFHGSPVRNWYSIMRKGLCVFSGTSRQANGAAYGKGIYLSDTASRSSSYCGGGDQAPGWEGLGRIVAVFEVSGQPELYRRAQHVFVVPRPELVVLRYILVWKEALYSLALDRYFNVSCPKAKREGRQILQQVAQRRLMKESKTLTELSDTGFIVSIADLSSWEVFMTFEDEPKSPLVQDLKKYGYDSVHLDVSFPSDYPIRPPFVRVIEPRFLTQTGHVTSGGSICMEILTSQGWRSTCSLLSLLVDIRFHILQGDGRLHPTQHSVAYTEEEAKSAFTRVSYAHGWV